MQGKEYEKRQALTHLHTCIQRATVGAKKTADNRRWCFRTLSAGGAATLVVSIEMALSAKVPPFRIASWMTRTAIRVLPLPACFIGCFF